MAKKHTWVYMRVTKDKYELPMAVADTVKELAEMTGFSINTINASMSHAKRKAKKCRFIKVELGEDDED